MSFLQQKRIRIIVFLVVVGLALTSGGLVNAMRELGGKEPVNDGPWPDGSVTVANLPSRLAYSVGGMGVETDHVFVYRGDTAAFQTALDTFAAIRAPERALFIHDGPHVEFFLKREKDDGHVDWTFTLWNPEGWYRHGGGHVPAPRIDVYVESPAKAGGIDWTLLKMPAKITVTDERAAAKVAATAAAAGPAVHGVIYNMANGKTISGARIDAQYWDGNKYAMAFTGTNDAVGAYVIDKLEPKSYRLVVVAKGYATRAINNYSVAAESRLTTDVELSKAVTIKGTVADEQEKPLAHVKVAMDYAQGIDGGAYALPEEMKAETDENGNFVFAGAPTGRGRFSCEVNGYSQLNPHTIWTLASWKAVKGDKVELTGEVPVVLHMAVPGSIRCKITTTNGAKLTDQDVQDFTINDAEGGYSRTEFKFQRTAHLANDGTVTFPEIPPGRYYLAHGYAVDMADELTTVRVTAGKTTETALAITPRPPRPAAEAPKPVKPRTAPKEDQF